MDNSNPMKDELDSKQQVLLKEILDYISKKIELKQRAVFDSKKLMKVGASRPIEENMKPESSPFHNRAANNWFKTRYSKMVPTNYLYFPDEIRKKKQMMDIFNNFDDDSNGKLDIKEFLNMFVHTFISSEIPESEKSAGLKHRFKVSIEIEKEFRVSHEEVVKLKKYLYPKFKFFYSFVTNNDYLEKTEFIMLALDKKASDYFNVVMKEVMKIIEDWKKKTELILPLSFEKMINYLGYRTKRDKLYSEFIQMKDTDFDSAGKKLEEIVFLRNQEFTEEEKEKENKMKMKEDEKKKLMDQKNFFMTAVGRYLMKMMKQKEEQEAKFTIHPDLQDGGSPQKTEQGFSFEDNKKAKLPSILQRTEIGGISQNLKKKIEKKILDSVSISSMRAISESNKEQSMVLRSQKQSVLKLMQRGKLSSFSGADSFLGPNSEKNKNRFRIMQTDSNPNNHLIPFETRYSIKSRVQKIMHKWNPIHESQHQYSQISFGGSKPTHEKINSLRSRSNRGDLYAQTILNNGIMKKIDLKIGCQSHSKIEKNLKNCNQVRTSISRRIRPSH